MLGCIAQLHSERNKRWVKIQPFIFKEIEKKNNWNLKFCFFAFFLVQEKYVICTIDNNGSLGNTKNMNLPGIVTDLPAMTEKDLSDIKFGVEKKIDIIAASFIRKV